MNASILIVETVSIPRARAGRGTPRPTPRLAAHARATSPEIHDDHHHARSSQKALAEAGTQCDGSATGSSDGEGAHPGARDVLRRLVASARGAQGRAGVEGPSTAATRGVGRGHPRVRRQDARVVRGRREGRAARVGGSRVLVEGRSRGSGHPRWHRVDRMLLCADACSRLHLRHHHSRRT